MWQPPVDFFLLIQAFQCFALLLGFTFRNVLRHLNTHSHTHAHGYSWWEAKFIFAHLKRKQNISAVIYSENVYVHKFVRRSEWFGFVLPLRQHLLENFCSSSVPNNPTVGQIWFNPDDVALYICVEIDKSPGFTFYYTNYPLAWLKIFPKVAA